MQMHSELHRQLIQKVWPPAREEEEEATSGQICQLWFCQTFALHKSEPSFWGFLQKKNGPCGVLAAVQAWLIYDLLAQGKQSHEPQLATRCDAEKAKTALITALCRMVANVAGTSSIFRLVFFESVENSSLPLIPTDPSTWHEHLVVCECNSWTSLYQLFQSKEDLLCQEGALVALIYSLVLTLEEEGSSSSSAYPLIVSPWGACSQGLVHLLLYGRPFPDPEDPPHGLFDCGKR